MRKTFYIFSLLIISIFITPSVSLASQKVVPNLEITAKKWPIGKVTVVSTGTDGHFSFDGLEAGDYKLFMNGQQIELGKYTINNGKISGKVLIDIEEDAPVVPVIPAAPVTPVAPAVPITAAVIDTVVADNKANFKFDEVNWEKNLGADHTAKIQEVLKKAKIIGASVSLNGMDSNMLKTYIRKLQLKYGIRTTGNVGPATAKKLNELLKASQN